ncbi:glycosyltransferase family 2 protein [Schaalia sp. ZJ1691]|uniref:glycosyltransferase family 2 protein n=1 Tax=Schaalia sp. ZJ1691 TaxID=2709404 RepID=UPI0013EC69FE|nr:glycosyltransferase family 2 protein [Schaalia sp. ZJ1691]
MTMPHLDSLDVIMPVFNEGDAVIRSLNALRNSARRAGISHRLIVVDDGSDSRDAHILNELAEATDVLLLRQENRGRFAARERGLHHAVTDYVLLLDARVALDEECLSFLRHRVEQRHEDIWNLDVHLANRTSLTAAFWMGLTAIWWRDYFRDRQEVLLDEQNFDRYPKGTGAFLVPRVLLDDAMKRYESLIDDPQLRSDDTLLLRSLAQSPGIRLSPHASCRYWGKEGAKKWVRQCYYRGTTFVDGYLTDPRRAPEYFALLTLAVTGAGLVALRFPKSFLSMTVGLSILGGFISRSCGAHPREATAVGVLSFPFSVFFTAGAVRGLRLIQRNRRDAT